MPYLADNYIFGSEEGTGASKEMLSDLSTMYSNIAHTVNRKADIIVTDVAPSGTPDANNNIPSTDDINFRNGTLWIKQTANTGPIDNEVYIMTETVVSGGNQTALWVRLA